MLGGTSLPWQFSARHEDQESWEPRRLRTSFPWGVKFKRKCENSYRGAKNSSDALDGGVTIVPVLIGRGTKGWVSPFWVKHISQCQLTQLFSLLIHSGTAEESCRLMLHICYPFGLISEKYLSQIWTSSPTSGWLITSPCVKTMPKCICCQYYITRSSYHSTIRLSLSQGPQSKCSEN